MYLGKNENRSESFTWTDRSDNLRFRFYKAGIWKRIAGRIISDQKAKR